MSIPANLTPDSKVPPNSETPNPVCLHLRDICSKTTNCCKAIQLWSPPQAPPTKPNLKIYIPSEEHVNALYSKQRALAHKVLIPTVFGRDQPTTIEFSKYSFFDPPEDDDRLVVEIIPTTLLKCSDYLTNHFGNKNEPLSEEEKVLIRSLDASATFKDMRKLNQDISVDNLYVLGAFNYILKCGCSRNFTPFQIGLFVHGDYLSKNPPLLFHIFKHAAIAHARDHRANAPSLDARMAHCINKLFQHITQNPHIISSQEEWDKAHLPLYALAFSR